MKPNYKRYHELVDRKLQTAKQDIGIKRAKPGMKRERDVAAELYELLRNYTYCLIGIQNAFQRIAGDFSGKDGSNWRNNRRPSSKRLGALADRLRSMNPDDFHAVIEVENELEKIVRECQIENDPTIKGRK